MSDMGPFIVWLGLDGYGAHNSDTIATIAGNLSVTAAHPDNSNGE